MKRVLLTQLETLGYAARVQHMVRLGRTFPTDAAVPPLLADLSASDDTYERLLCAMSLQAFGGRRAPLPQEPQQREQLARIAAALAADTDAKTQQLSLGVFARLSSADELRAYFLSAPYPQVAVACRAAAAVPALAAAIHSVCSDAAALAELPAGTRRCLLQHWDVRRAEPSRLPLTAVPEEYVLRWARRYPAAVAAALEAQLEPQTQPQALRRRAREVATLVRTLCHHHCRGGGDAAAVMDTVYHYATRALPVIAGQLNKEDLSALLSALAWRRPVETARFIAETRAAAAAAKDQGSGNGAALMVSLCIPSRRGERRFLRRVPPAVLQELAVGKGKMLQPQGVFARLPLSVRLAIAETAPHALVRGNTIPWEVLSRVPSAELRERLVRDYCARPQLKANVGLRLRYLSLLPYDEAFRVMEEEKTLSDPDVNWRAAALTALIATSRNHPASFLPALRYAATKGREQDPFRCAMIDALRGVAVKLWRDAQTLGPLEDVVRQTLAAKDASTGTVAALCALLTTRVVLAQPEAAVRLWAVVLDAQRDISLPSEAPAVLHPDRLRLLCDALFPRLMAQVAAGEDWRRVRHCLDTLPRRFLATTVAAQTRELLEALLASGDPVMALVGFQQLARCFPADAAARVPRMLAEGGGEWVVVPTVRTVLGRDLQGECLAKYLGILPAERAAALKRSPLFLSLAQAGVSCSYALSRQEPPSLRLLEMPVGYAWRWTGAQQRCYAAAILQAVREVFSDDSFRQRRLVTWLARLPAVPLADGLGALVGAEVTPAAVRDRAVLALGHRQDAESLRLLHDGLADERAAEAVLALLMRLRHLPSRRKVEAVAAVLARPHLKVTSEKELLRTLGAEGTDEALAAVDAHVRRRGEKLHPSVHGAYLTVLLRFLHKPEVWDRLEREAEADDVVANHQLLTIRYGELTEEWQRERFCRLMARLLRSQHLPVIQSALRALLGSRATLVITPELLETLYGVLRHGSRLPGILTSAITLALSFPAQDAAAAARHIFTATSGDYKALTTAVRALYSPGRLTSAALVALYADVAEALSAHVLAETAYARLAALLVLALPPARWADAFAALHARGALHPGAMVDVVAAVASGQRAEAVAEMEELEAAQWRTHAMPLMRRIGLATLVAVARAHKWSPERRRALQTHYRRDADAWVREDALLEALPLDDQE